MGSARPVGRPSTIGILVCTMVVVFGIFWTSQAVYLSPFLGIFGLLFVAIGVVIVIRSLKSSFGVKGSFGGSGVQPYEVHREPDPFDRSGFTGDGRSEDTLYCPFCGTLVEREFEYCRRCGRNLP